MAWAAPCGAHYGVEETERLVAGEKHLRVERHADLK
jgi:hypothetical protein